MKPKREAPKKPRIRLTHQQSQEIAVEAVVALSTVYRWAAGHPVHGTTDVRLTRACQRKGLKPEAVV